jgi:amino acid transporter
MDGDLWKGFGTALLGVLWAYHGWMNIAPLGGEVKRPNRDLPLAMVLGVVVVIVLYLGANLAYYLVIPQEEIATLRNTTVATVFSMRLLGPLGAAAASAAVMCSVFGALNGNLMVGPRLLYAMGEDGLAPRYLGAVHPTFHTPARAIMVMGGWASLLVLGVTLMTYLGVLSADKDHFNVLTDFAMFGAVIFETAAVSTIFVFRRRVLEESRTYSCPLYPLLPAVYVIIMMLVLASMFWAPQSRNEALIGLGFVSLGAVVFRLIEARGR